MRSRLLLLVVVLAMASPWPNGRAAEVVLPQERKAYYSDEAVELAVAGLARGAGAKLEIVPQGNFAAPVSAAVAGDGSTVTLVVPPGALAPGNYLVKLEGKEQARLTISSGVRQSTCLVSQTVGWDELKPGGADYILGNAFSFGRLLPNGPMTTNLRAARSGGLTVFDRAIAENLPTVVYMYWTGYVTHKPFGSNKSWAASDMTESMRLLSFHTAQRLRQVRRNVVCVGTLDEPGLGWGKTPAGGSASGFPDWDEAAWYESRGWKYTSDVAAGSDADWMKYMTIRCAVLKECNAQAKKDLKTVWPEMVFSTDLYAPHAIMDGTDPLNQQVNDVPASHVFLDWGIDRLGVYSGIMLEKAHDPTAKVAHAANGQLFGPTVPQPAQRYAYRACLNGMLAAGMASNWWLNTGGMRPEDLAAVNGPAKRIGPLLGEMSTAGHDVAVLWSFTEAAMRQKEIAAREARKKPGEKITHVVASLPENTAIRGPKEIEINAYSVGGDYKESVLAAHYALARAGYPAHVVHERLLPGGVLKNYRTLVIASQTFPLPADAMQAIRAFTASGGRVVADQSTTVDLDGKITAGVNLRGLSFQWGPLFNQDAKTFKTPREASYFQTNFFMDEPIRRAVAPLKAAMRQTSSIARMETDSNELLCERHVGGEGQLYMVASGFERLPGIGERDAYPIYNYASHVVRFALKGLPANCVVYTLEGGDWNRPGKLPRAAAGIFGHFDPGEMKLFLVAPREPAGLDVAASAAGGMMSVTASLRGVAMPWPLRVSIADPAGKPLYEVHRATGTDGHYREGFPLGANAPSGIYRVSVDSPLAGLKGQAQVQHQVALPAIAVLADRVRVFDAPAIRSFLGAKPEVTVAVGHPSHQAAAEQLAAALSARGLRAAVRPESQVLTKVRYPRVWNPYATVHRAAGPEKPLAGRKVERQIELGLDAAGALRAKTADGKDLGFEWRQAHGLVTVAGDGFVDWSGDAEVCYEAGVKLYIEPDRRLTVLRGEPSEQETSAEFRARWSRPWTHLWTHVGAYQYPPQMPEAYTADSHLILLGDSTTSVAVAAVQAGELPQQLVDGPYPGPGKALVSFLWSPFAVEKNAILLGAADSPGLTAAIARLLEL